MRKSRSSTNVRRTEVWIGLAEVRPRPGDTLLGRAVGAFVNVLALAPSPEGFLHLATDALNEYAFDVAAISDVERLSERIRRAGVVPYIEQLATELTPQTPVLFDNFQSYLSANDELAHRRK